MHFYLRIAARVARSTGAGLLTLAALNADAAEGGLGRPIAGMSIVPKAGMVAPEPIWITSFGQTWFDGSISGDVPIAGQSSAGLDADFALTLATMVKVWDTGPDAWNFASGATVSYIKNDVSATLSGQGLQGSLHQSAYGMFDFYVTPVVAGYHISGNEHVALSLNIWAPTGSYYATRIANTGLNTWTFIPQVAYTKLWPDTGWEFDAVGTVQFYTRNADTDYQNAPLFTLDLMGLKHFANGWSAGLVTGTVQQVGNDTGPTADTLDGFVGHDLAIGPILTYETKLAAKAPLSFSLRWVPTVASQNRLDSTSTILGTATLIF